MIISIIAAIGNNRVIGIKNSLPWDLPADMEHFRKLTFNKPVIMGAKTFESIGKPLANRKNIVLTDNESYNADGCIVVHSINEALEAAEGSEEAMIAGGASVYRQFLPLANRMYLTFIHHDFDGDSFFPEYGNEWKQVSRENHQADKDNFYPYSFVIFEK